MRNVISRLTAFWKKDFINKLIVLQVVLILLAGIGLVMISLMMPEGKSFMGAVAEYVPMVNTPTIEYKTPTATPRTPTPTTEKIYIPTKTQTPQISAVTPTNTPTLPPANSPTPTATATLASINPTATPTTLAQVSSTPSTPKPKLTPGTGIAACVPDNPPQTGRVLDVIDSVTIKVMINDLVYVVRYIGLAPVPETSPYYRASLQRNAALVFNKDVQLIADVRDKDDAGHLMRYVIIGDTFVNAQIVRDGFALVIDSAPNDSCAQMFRDAEASAKADQINIWLPTPTFPAP